MAKTIFKGAHLTDRKLKQLMELFCEDLTATQIANITGVSRITVNSYIRKMRQLMTFQVEFEKAGAMAFQTDLKAETMQLLTHEQQPDKQELAGYALMKIEGRVFSDPLFNLSPTVRTLVKQKKWEELTEMNERFMKRYSGLIAPDLSKMTRFQGEMDIADSFWAFTRSRLVKFKGISKQTGYYHLKESEFRFLYRQQPLFPVLMKLIRQHTAGNRFPLSIFFGNEKI